MKLFLFVLIASIYCIQILDCCAYGEGCRFPCHCNIGVTCDPVTGICEDGSCKQVLPEGHDFGWKDSGCRRGNIALNKTTNQSGDFDVHTSDRAVDGNTNPNLTHGSCAHPSFHNNEAWWMVDLERNYIIEEIIIFNRDERGERTNDFTIRIGVNDTIQDQPLCINYTKGQEEVLHLNCPEPVSEGRFISMERNQGGEEPGQINICEFVVIGFAPMDCNENCDGNCHLLTGCDKCYPGYKLPDCIDECNSSSWGVNCANRCGGCASQTCDKVSGSCNWICQEWYINDKCSTYIEKPSLERAFVEVNTISSAELKVEWNQFEGVKDRLDEHYYYKVEYGPTGSQRIISDIVRHDSNNTSASILLAGLAHNTEYEIKVVPYRVQGSVEQSGLTSGTKRIKTLGLAPLESPNTALLVGSTVGIVGAVVIVIISVIIYRGRKAMQLQTRQGRHVYANESIDGETNFSKPGPVEYENAQRDESTKAETRGQIPAAYYNVKLNQKIYAIPYETQSNTLYDIADNKSKTSYETFDKKQCNNPPTVYTELN